MAPGRSVGDTLTSASGSVFDSSGGVLVQSGGGLEEEGVKWTDNSTDSAANGEISLCSSLEPSSGGQSTSERGKNTGADFATVGSAASHK